MQPSLYPENANFVADSIRWTKKFGDKTGLYRSDRLFLMGHSAGGHLAACVALHGTGHRHEVIDDIKVGIMSVGCTWTSFDTMNTECGV